MYSIGVKSSYFDEDSYRMNCFPTKEPMSPLLMDDIKTYGKS